MILRASEFVDHKVEEMSTSLLLVRLLHCYGACGDLSDEEVTKK